MAAENDAQVAEMLPPDRKDWLTVLSKYSTEKVLYSQALS